MPATKMDQALECHRAGNLEMAEKLYREILETDPENSDALYGLGLLARQIGALPAAVEFMERALVNGGAAERLNTLGTLLQALGRIEDAEAAFARAVAADPKLVPSQVNLAALLQARGRLEDAADLYEAALETEPGFVPALVNLGALRRQQGDLPFAADLLRRAVAGDPASARAHNNLGTVHHEQGDLDDAATCLETALELAADYPEALVNLGTVYRDQGRLEDAVDRLEQAVELAPELAEAHNVLGTVRHRQARYLDARTHLERAVQLNPEFSDAHFNLSETLFLLGDDLESAWMEFDWRWRTKPFAEAVPSGGPPWWQGEDLSENSIFVHAEQGVGEELMFATILADLKTKAARVLMSCDPRLIPLFERSYPGVSLVDRSDHAAVEAAVATTDYQVAAGGLGRWLRPRFASFPGKSNARLIADQGRVDGFRQRYERAGRSLRVGISWRSRDVALGWRKSLPLVDWGAILEVPDAVFVDLQYGDTAADRNNVDAEIIHDETVDQMKDLDSFAAQVASLDLVISVSNTTAHMAGALGVPTWVLLSEVPLWRWFRNRDDSPWYPSARLFRIGDGGNWESVVERVAAALEQYRLEFTND